MQFPGNIAIQSVIQKIKEETNHDQAQDHALFDPANKRWLRMEKTLFYYDVSSNHVLEFKKKHRPLKVKLLDGALKTVLIDESLPVQQLVDYSCDKLNINNPEEFSFGVEVTPDASHKKKKEEDATLLTDQAFKWLNPDQTLPEQSVTLESIVVLKKKFYFSDQNVDRTDPVQLNLVYTQARNQIISEKHPCTLEESIQFAALQCQIQHGKHDNSKHKPGFLPLKEFLPKEYVKTKDIEKRIYAEHAKLTGLNDLNAKYRYVQLSRSLRTYGVTFFLVKEKTKKKGAMENVLLGITKEKILRFDYKTKEVIHSWPITTLRRWAATPNSLTLDFGDHSDAFYTVQTHEGDAISQLIGGYIEIIMRKKRDGDRKVEEGRGEIAITESIQRAPKAHTAQAMSVREQKAQLKSIGTVQAIKPAQTVAQVVKVGLATHHGVQKKNDAPKIEMNSVDAVQHHLQSGYAAVNSSCLEMQFPSAVQPIDTVKHPEAASWKMESFYKHGGSMNSKLVKHVESCALLLNEAILNKDHLNFDAIGGAIFHLSSNLNQLASDAKVIGCFCEDDDEAEKLLEITKKLGAMTAECLLAIQNSLEGDLPPQELYKACQNMSEAVDEMVKALQQENATDEMKQDVFSTAQTIALEASQAPPNEQVKAMSNHIMAVTKTIMPMMDVEECKQQGAMAIEYAEHVISELGPEYANLLGAIKTAKDTMKGEKQGSIDEQAQKLLALTTDAIKTGYDPDLMLSQIKQVTQASAELSTVISNQLSDATNEEDKAQYKQALKLISSRTNALVQDTKKWAQDADDEATKAAVIQDLVKLQAAIRDISGETVDTAMTDLTKECTQLILSCSALLSTCSGAGLTNSNPQSQRQVMIAARKVFNNNADLTGILMENKVDKTPMSQMKLINYAKDAIKCNEALLQSTQSAADHVMDPSLKKQMVDNSEKVKDHLEQVKLALNTVSCFGDIGGPEFMLNNVMDLLQRMKKDCDTVLQDPSALDKENLLGDMDTLQGQVHEQCKALVFELNKIKSVEDSAILQEVSQNLQKIYGDMRQLSAIHALEGSYDPMMQAMAQVLETAIASVQEAQDGELKPILIEPLNALLASLPQQETLKEVIEQLDEALYMEVEDPKEALFKNAAQLGGYMNQLTNAQKMPMLDLVKVMGDIGATYQAMETAAQQLYPQLKEQDQEKVKELMAQIHDSSLDALTCGKRASHLLTDLQLKDQLTGNTAKMNMAVQELLQTVNEEEEMVQIHIKEAVATTQAILQQTPGQLKEFEAHQEEVLSHSKVIQEALAPIVDGVDATALQQASDTASKALEDMANDLSKCLFLIGCLDPETVKGTPSDRDLLKDMRQHIDTFDGATKAQQLQQATADIAKLTNAAIQECAKYELQDDALAIRQAVQGFVANVKTYSKDMSPENKEASLTSCEDIYNAIANMMQKCPNSETVYGPKATQMQKASRDAFKRYLAKMDQVHNTLSILALNPSASSGTALQPHLKQLKDIATILQMALEDQSPDKKKSQEEDEKLQTYLIDLDAALLKCATDGLAPEDFDKQSVADLLNQLPEDPSVYDALHSQFLGLLSSFNPKAQLEGVQLLKDLTEAMLAKEPVDMKVDDIFDFVTKYEAMASKVDQVKAELAQVNTHVLETTPTGTVVPLAKFLNDCQQLIQHLKPEHLMQLPQLYNEMGESIQIALKTTSDAETLQVQVNALATSLSTFADSCIGQSNRLMLNREISKQVQSLIASVKNANPGLEKIEDAVSVLNESIMPNIESTLVFAQAGQLDAKEGTTFKDYHQDIQLAVKQLVEDVKALVSATPQSITVLGEVSSHSSGHMQHLWDLSKDAIGSITSADKLTQVELLKAASDVSQTMNELISTALQLQTNGKSQGDAEYAVLPQVAKKTAASIAHFYKAVELVGDEKTRATKAITNVLDDLKEQQVAFVHDFKAEGSAMPDDVLKCSKDVANSVAQMMFHINKKEELVVKLNDNKKLVDEMIRTTRASIENAPDTQKNKMKQHLQLFFDNYSMLLSNLDGEKSSIEEATKKVAMAVGHISDAAKQLMQENPAGFVDEDDPNYIAEQELIAAANAIDIASRKLAKMTFEKSTDGEMSFGEACAEIARAVLGASHALIKAATSVQREISAKGYQIKTEAEMFFNDGTWSDGLVSAAKIVVGCIGDLVQLVNEASKGKVQPEKILVVARSIASGCAHLIASASVKVDLESQAQLRLKAAGKQVTGAVENLVKTVEDKIEPEEFVQETKASGVRGRIGEMNAQAEILRMERELDQARNRLAGMRKDKYVKEDKSGTRKMTQMGQRQP